MGKPKHVTSRFKEGQRTIGTITTQGREQPPDHWCIRDTNWLGRTVPGLHGNIQRPEEIPPMVACFDN